MLADDAGCPVLDTNGNPIELGPQYQINRVSASANGSLLYKGADNIARPLGIQIGLFQFNNPEGLEKLDSSLYRQTAASGNALNEATANNIVKSSIKQGYLEGSNVQLADEMVNLIVAQRAYEANSKAITTSDEMMSQANQLKR